MSEAVETVAPVVPPSEAPRDPGSQNAANSEPQTPATAVPEAPESPTDGESGEQPKGKNWAARKIDQLTRQAAEARENEQRLLRILEQQTAPRQQQQVPQQPPQEQGPQRQQFSDYEAYLDARAEWKSAQAADSRFAAHMQGLQRAQQQATQQQQADKIARDAAARMEEGRKSIPDFDQVVSGDALDLPVSQAAGVAIAHSESPAKVIHYFAQHPDKLERINAMPPLQAAREIGRIEVALDTPPQISKAPPPGKPVGARGGSPDGYRENMSMDDFVRWRKSSKTG